MAIAMIAEIPGVTREQIDAARAVAAPGGRPATGLLYHLSGQSDDGWIVIDVWESQQALERFMLLAGHAFQQAGIPAIQPRLVPIYETLAPPTAEQEE